MAEEEGSWLTYAEAAAHLGIKAESVRRRAISRKWPRRQGNDGKARIQIPEGATITRDGTGDATPAITPDVTRDDEMAARLAVAEARLADAQAALADLREDRDRWRVQAETLAARPRDWLSRLLGR